METTDIYLKLNIKVFINNLIFMVLFLEVLIIDSLLL